METTLKWVNLNKRNRYLTMEWWDKSDLFTDNEVPSLGTVLHCPCHHEVAYCAFPRVIFSTYAPVILNKALRFTRTNSLSCFTPQCLQELCPRLCLHNSLKLVTDTPLQSVPSPRAAHIWRNSWNMLFDQNLTAESQHWNAPWTVQVPSGRHAIDSHITHLFAPILTATQAHLS